MPYVEASVRRAQLIGAARTALARDGVAGTSLRAVAAQAGVPLGTMQYVFPSKEKLLQAVIEDVVEEIAEVLQDSAELDRGLAHAIREGVRRFWSSLVAGHRGLQLMQYELTTYALRAGGQEHLARWQYERYCRVVAEWCQAAAHRAGETCAVPFGRLARVIVAGLDGLILQYVCDPDESRSREDVEAMVDMVVALAGPGRT
ncbi:TetR/AcrR family transcriptional regulator [Pseudonocardia endophytica]|uniref:TetR family transcriptional regulator n=1 Tax=Pseudonocardia endophytica TaxID=401976 RepID=A0A4R1I5B4_PSEEN|nr:TetR/AcrR family transcriptional regulator [Pseudonocardia endophytica]TCK25222.1 TetR family transcriptional regulator [Pseudonocardia endophytica]